MPDEKRPYRKKQRAELEEQTRRRITESAVELHGTVGPSRTSMSAIADRAGVRRSTLYRHFPDEAAIYAACTAHWRAANPSPDPEAWAAIADPAERLARALPELYAFFARNEQMLANLFRDEQLVEAVSESFAAFRGYLDACRDVLLQRRGLRGHARTRVRAALGLAVSFHTWRSLTAGQGLDDEAAAALMQRLVAAAR